MKLRVLGQSVLVKHHEAKEDTTSSGIIVAAAPKQRTGLIRADVVSVGPDTKVVCEGDRVLVMAQVGRAVDGKFVINESDCWAVIDD